jgi:acetylornithine deacetylase/succinyl-diaminopimelate desuccinylase-like protein
MSNLADRRAAALAHAAARLEHTLEELKTLARIPGVSADPPPNAELAKSADAVAAWMKRIGLDGVEVVTLPGVHPYVYGEWLGAPGAPTAIIYAHHDVQPPGRPSHWKSPMFEPTVRDGRMYGRGVVDDKAGAAIQFAAIEAYLKNGGLPINVKVVIDGEEEIGSEHLGDFLAKFKERLAADVIVLTDTANLATGVPSVTYALRGIVIVDVDVAALDHPLHSGMWGGPVPDAPMAMCKILGRLVDDQGRIAIPGIYEDVRPMTDAERGRLQALPFDAAEFRSDAGMLEGVGWAGEKGHGHYELMWRRPTIAITAMEASPLAGASNQIIASARARVGIRTVPDMDGRKVAAALAAALAKDPPWGVKVTTHIHAVGGWWITNPEGPAFEAASKALGAGYGVPATFIGCGGSIPFVEPFSTVLGGIPALLLGLEDPVCNAHSENESLHLGDFEKAVAATVHLYAELAAAGAAALRGNAKPGA